MSSDEGQICHSGAADVGVLRMIVLDVHQQQFVISKQFVAGFNWTPYTLEKIIINKYWQTIAVVSPVRFLKRFLSKYMESLLSLSETLMRLTLVVKVD